jgi:hypothetical protein
LAALQALLSFVEIFSPMSSARTKSSVNTRSSLMRLSADNNKGGPSFVERGVSVDQDGKSNVWAIEPKVEVESKSSEEKGTAALLAGGGLVVCAAAAALILTNLPDPNQF